MLIIEMLGWRRYDTILLVGSIGLRRRQWRFCRHDKKNNALIPRLHIRVTRRLTVRIRDLCGRDRSAKGRPDTRGSAG